MGNVHNSGETRKFMAQSLPLYIKVMASEKDTPANKISYDIVNATIQTLVY